MTSSASDTTALRIVTFNTLPQAFGLVAGWIAQAGHKHVLAVTTPGPAARRSDDYKAVAAMLPPEVDLLITTRLRRVATPLIRELRPDLIISFTFPYRLPPELRACARIGAVNLHPGPLPAYRGPNPLRAIYDGHHELGAALHWTEDEFDAGNILSRHVAPIPTSPTPEQIFAAWVPTIGAVLTEGLPRAIAGDPGEPQDEALASYAAAFSEAEHWLNWQEPTHVVQRKAAALSIFGTGARAQIAGRPYLVERVTTAELGASAAPGSVVSQEGAALLIAAADGLLLVTARPLEA